MDEIFIKDLLLHGIIGVYEWERKQPQKILINVRLFTENRQAGKTDQIQDSIDYGELVRTISAFVEKSSRFTVEALAEDLALLCKKHPLVQKVIIRVEKPGVIKEASSVGVQIER